VVPVVVARGVSVVFRAAELITEVPEEVPVPVAAVVVVTLSMGTLTIPITSTQQNPEAQVSLGVWKFSTEEHNMDYAKIKSEDGGKAPQFYPGEQPLTGKPASRTAEAAAPVREGPGKKPSQMNMNPKGS
jgi:hypothetical protein